MFSRTLFKFRRGASRRLGLSLMVCFGLVGTTRGQVLELPAGGVVLQLPETPKVDPKADPKADPKVDPKAAPKSAAKSEATPLPADTSAAP